MLLRMPAAICLRGPAAWLWCALLLAAHGTAIAAPPAPPVAPAIDCAKAAGVDTLICRDRDLVNLEARLAYVYSLAEAQTTRWGLASPRADQQQWQRGRASCAKQAEVRACLLTSGRRRVAELLAVYALVPGTAPRSFTCGGADAQPVLLIFFGTEPATAVARRGDDTVTLYQEPTASGIRYAGSGWVYAEHQGEVRIITGPDAPERRCRLQREAR